MTDDEITEAMLKSGFSREDILLTIDIANHAVQEALKTIERITATAPHNISFVATVRACDTLYHHLGKAPLLIIDMLKKQGIQI
jgi:superfamily II DNA helicase RecQ